MEKLIAYRTHSSPYQGPDFSKREEAALNDIGVDYSNSCEQANILITNTHTDLQQYNLSNIQLIVHPNSGYDNFTPKQLQEAPCPVIIGNPVRAMAVSNYILSSFFSHCSKSPSHTHWDKQRLWPRVISDRLTVQLIGHGHIGKTIETVLSPLVKKLMIYDPFQKMHELSWSEADVIIFACGLNSSNKKMLGKKEFSSLKDNVLIINPARGELIDQSELWDFLTKKPSSFAFLDVFENEPAPLENWILPNAQFSSHIAGVTADLEQRIIDYEVQVISDFLKMQISEFQMRYAHLILQNRVIKGELI